MHCVCIVYANSCFYNSPARIIVLMQETCNLLIEAARKYMDPSSLFQVEVEEALDKVLITLKIFNKFRAAFREFKGKLSEYFKESNKPKTWDFQEHLVFSRFDSFVDRLNIIKEFFKTAQQFLKLEKVEIGGIRGKALSSRICYVHEEFKDLYGVFSNRTYDSLDPKDESFIRDYEHFKSRTFELDRKLGAVLGRAFDDCLVTESIFKLLQIFGSLIQRNLIALELSDRMPMLVTMLNQEMDESKVIYTKQMQRIINKGKPHVDRNMPFMAGQLKWAQELKAKMSFSVKSFKDLNHPICYKEGAKNVFRKFKEMMQLLTTFEDDVFQMWNQSITKKMTQSLNKPLLIRDSDNSLRVNFGKDLMSVLREVRFLKKEFPLREFPGIACELFEREDTFRNYVNSLDQTVDHYNKIKNHTKPVEFELVEKEVSEIDDQLEKAEHALNWNSEGIWSYMENLRALVTDLSLRVSKCQQNVLIIKKLMDKWNDKPMFERCREPKTEDLMNIKDMPDKKRQRYNEVTEANDKITDLIQECQKYFQCSNDLPAWHKYLSFVDQIIVNGMLRSAASSLGYLVDETDSNLTQGPLIEVKLELAQPDVIFKPSLDHNIQHNFYDLVQGWIEDIFHVTKLIPRVALPENETEEEEAQERNYYEVISNHKEIKTLKETLMNRVKAVMVLANKYRKSHNDHSYLWTESRQEFMHYFLTYGRQLSQEELDALEEDEKAVKKQYPPLDQFKEQIDYYEELHDQLKNIENVKLFQSWFRVDSRPFRLALLTCIKRWGYAFKKHLMDHVVNSLAELNDFIERADEGLMTQVHEGDYEGLIKVMEFLQTMEVGKLKKRIQDFESKEIEFRVGFQKMRFYQFKCRQPYELLAEANGMIDAMEFETKKLIDSAMLFEVSVPNFRLLTQCRKEIKMLKALWDYIFLVRTSIDEWKTTPWKDIDVENMDMECKKFSKDVRGLDKDMRGWDAFNGLEVTVKNMLTSLRAVGELQNPAIRDRHWQQLVSATRVKFVMSEETTLADLLNLNLHNFEDEVHNIVDKAIKEMAMERMLRELEVVWTSMEFQHEVHTRTGYTLLRTSEELIETLEENQVQLQNMMASKYISYFLDEISSWQKCLSMVDQVISLWFDVQRTWSHLESIFIGSEDIRKQLPVDSQRFDEIDTEFKVLMKQMAKTPNVVQATNVNGLADKLEVIQSQLSLCEKALAEYLETKRLAFPRFYFASSNDLLDILSNGNQPLKVSKHLTKLFDSMAKLKLKTDEAGNSTNNAIAMFAKDGEYVEFKEECVCEGQVEVWLNRLMDTMRSTIRHYMTHAVATYEEKPRDHWLFDYPAQVSLCGTQIWWTAEVGIAFGKLEEGYENAIKDYYKKQIAQLNNLITLLLGTLTKGDRQKIMTICTIDVHSRDVVGKMISNKIESALAFMWQSQLRHRWDDARMDCFANICDAEFQYWHEYLGNTPRLVITPLTDRCYITLTQSLHLVMGGAPAGPAGTGKTETTKDLGRALGMMVYVFNCSEQMDYKSCGNIYKGLAQTGAWGCFDEFNRITVEVLSVIAVQVKSIQDAIKESKTRFDFMGEDIPLNPTVGIFITMNPGYAGRAELPENLKALFRPCAMVVPDLGLICEIMLVAEGFLEARTLSRKFITLYTLCKELLSKQDHYDWGLRAIKSVLVVAGALKRGDPERPEDQVLMRALRDFNLPKIVSDDNPVFLGLISDLFPSLDVPRKRELEFEKAVKHAACDLKLQPEENFVLKVVQLEELLYVRHSAFIVGNAGTGKSQVWKTLFRTFQNLKKKPVFNDLNPKVQLAVTNDELYGIINPATREWKDGLFSVIMRDQANLTTEGPKWIILDGDIDPMWIESLNTVMDDNKILTLASNERIALTPEMRLIFEISNLRTATPATVSRAGILYINPGDLGWNPFVTSWIETREGQAEKAGLTILFDKYIPILSEVMKHRFKKITPIPDIAHVETLCRLLECLIIPQNIPVDGAKELYELYFVFACVWAFGSALYFDGTTDHRAEFSKWWLNEFKSVKFPANGTIFDFYVDSHQQEMVPWVQRVPKFELDPDLPLQAVLVHTAETVRVKYFLDMLVDKRHPVMLVGGAGCGKTVLINEKLSQLSDNYMVANVPFNYYYTSEMLQKILEKPLEKKAGKNFGPPGNKKLVYFLDDMNMPEVDMYGTVQPHTLIRQHLDYKHWYDRNKLTPKDIHNCQYLACMNPCAGSFTINPRLQRHFATFAVSFPGQDSLYTIYNAILSDHLDAPGNKFPFLVRKMCSNVVHATLQLHAKISQVFMPTAVKFHYIFNLRDLSNVFQGLLFASNDCVNTPTEIVRLWCHETHRVYMDKLADNKDIENFEKIQKDILKKQFDDVPESEVLGKPLIYCHFAKGIGEPKYMPIQNWDALNKILTDALQSYNELNAAMDLVLFEDAMSHICRINRILESPRGNALLVGVGGSGKQSLSRLAAYISSMEVFQVTLRKGYSSLDLKGDLANLYQKTGLKNLGTVFLMTDAQVADERFLVLINNLLASGEIPDLFSDDEVENIVTMVRNEVKGAGLQDTRENCWKFFIDRVRRQLKVVLCFSPVGSTLRIRGRKFPALINCTCIDWFHEWPQEALMSVSMRFLRELPVIPTPVKQSIAQFMSYVHGSVNEMSKVYLANERRHNYTTPKSFLELINLYMKILKQKHEELEGKMQRLENGLEKLRVTAEQVAFLKAQLAEQEIELTKKNEEADKLIEIVGVETEKVSKEKSIADDEELRVNQINKEVSGKQRDCEADLKKAEPALEAAQQALNTLNKANLTELKSFGSPPPAVINVTSAVMVLLSTNGKIPKDRSWQKAKIMMSKIDQFLESLVQYDKENIHPNIITALEPYLKDREFDPEFIRSKSAAAAGLCSWVINIVKFFEVYCDVEPKRRALEEANDELAEARDTLARVKAKVVDLEATLAKLTNDYQKAIDEKMRCQQEADETTKTIALANRLVNGLASEKIRWSESVQKFREQGKMLPGDVLIVASFISYLGCFTKQYRLELFERKWLPYLKKLPKQIPLSLGYVGANVLALLTDDALIAQWNNEGLPSDNMSTENATILTNSVKWPLMIDPQLQGIKWIKNRFTDKLTVIRLGQKGYLDTIEKCVCRGMTLLIENLDEEIEPVLDPLLGRLLIKKGKAIRLGDKEVEYSPLFRLYLHTKMANPHYKPELQAQTTLINFTVTRQGLEDQLLAEVVKADRPDLEEQKADLTRQQNEYKILLKSLEDDLLMRLSSAGDNILSDSALVENLEHTKKTAADIEVKVSEAKRTSFEIDKAREFYRPAAARASVLYFILNDLYKINPIYQFSLKAFSVVFHVAIERAEQASDVKIRVDNLTDCITYSVFQYTTRGLFECDKLIFTAQMAFQILLMKKEVNQAELDFLLRFPVTPNITSPVDFISNIGWGAIKSLAGMEDFRNLDRDIENNAKRWRKFVEAEAPEKEKFPQEWKKKDALQRLCMMRCLRPDRMTYAVIGFVQEKLGPKFVENRSVEFSKSFEESGPTTPIFFILSPGVNPLKDVEALGKKLSFTQVEKNFHNVSLGQGQEIVAENAMEIASREGHWVILQNIHLVKTWLPSLEKKIEEFSEGSHPSYRLFLSAEPAPTPENHIIPQSILEASIKITNEPPTGMQANLHKALDNFDQDTLEMCSKEAEFKSILFSLCYFHAVVAERRKFGPQGWNKSYPFNTGDLVISMNVLFNYLEANNRIPWEDLRYLFGEIMYGGHITDDWDRRLCKAYLEEYMHPDQLDGELMLAPSFPTPPNMDYLGYHNYITENLPQESPNLYGLHPNAEIGFLTATSEKLFRTVFELQPREGGASGGPVTTREEKIKSIVDDIMEKLPDAFNMSEIMGKVEERTPYVVVAFQECERMNILTKEMRRSLKELDLGLKGELTITPDMEDLGTSLFFDQVPPSWTQRAYASLHGLSAWYVDLLLRIKVSAQAHLDPRWRSDHLLSFKELESWTSDFSFPPTIWLSGFFNPQSFLTAIMQSTARKNELPLDKMSLACEVTKKNKEEIQAPPREGAYIHGLFMEGARSDIKAWYFSLALFSSLHTFRGFIKRKRGHVSVTG
eukprot:maker-scaffold103_size370364-snap-gene-1.20 protein:Tk07513 transcript:maker-scaffold103_size370364-snap-gene-1.20-mRNA-1 annotation:"dynein beta ciliary-like"